VVTTAAPPNLTRAEIDASVVIGDHDLAVHQRTHRQCLASLQELREPRPKITAVAAQQLNSAGRSVPQQATKTVQLGLVPPDLARGQARFQLSKHRKRRVQHGTGAYAGMRLWRSAEG
jgi:hypothetical protein